MGGINGGNGVGGIMKTIDVVENECQRYNDNQKSHTQNCE